MIELQRLTSTTNEENFYPPNRASSQETDLSRAEAEVILAQMNNIITQLPQARRKAHERIIGERAVPSG